MKKINKILLPFLLIVAIIGTASSQKHIQHKKQQHKKVKHVKKVHNKPHHNHHHYAHLPKKGFISAKPKGALLVIHSGHNYHLHQGVWYRPHQDKFIVFGPHAGVSIKLLPAKHHVCVVRKRTYYYYYGTYYSKVDGIEEYEVVDVPVGAQVQEIPDDYQLQDIEGVEHYVVDNVHYVYHEDTAMYEVISVK